MAFKMKGFSPFTDHKKGHDSSKFTPGNVLRTIRDEFKHTFRKGWWKKNKK